LFPTRIQNPDTPRQDQYRVEYRVPRLRRAAGHAGDRARNRRHRLGSRPRSARRAQGQSLRRRARRHAVWPNGGRLRRGAAADRAARAFVELPRTAQGDCGIQRALADFEEGAGADAGEIRHFVHAHPPQSGRRAGARLSGRLRSPQSRRHGNGPRPVPESSAGRRRRTRHRARARAHHRDLDRQGAEHVRHRRIVRHRSQRHGRAACGGEIKGRLTRFASETWKVSEEHITLRDDRVFIGNESIPFGELTKKAHAGRVHLSAAGFYKTPKLHWDREKGKGRPFFYYAYGAACSEVVIDILSGEMKVRRVDILHDVGRSINPAIDIGQIEGAFVQGMGWLTTEELVYDEKGRLLTHAPSTYKIPVASDVPADFRVALFEGSNREDTVYRSKAVGEPPLMLAI